MKTSESITKITEALHAFQKDISTVKKDATNPFFHSTYVTLEAVLAAVMPKLNEVGIVVIQGGTPSDKNVLAVSTRLIHTSGEWIESTLELPILKPDPQSAGSSTTYARRYSLLSMLGLGAEDDDGNEASKSKYAAGNFVKPEGDTYEVKTCKECGANMRFAQGTVKKPGKNFGKPYKGYFCTKDPKHSPEFIND